MLNNVMLMNKYTRFDSLTLSQEMASNIDRLFELFEIIENGVSHELTYEEYVKEYRNGFNSNGSK